MDKDAAYRELLFRAIGIMRGMASEKEKHSVEIVIEDFRRAMEKILSE